MNLLHFDDMKFRYSIYWLLLPLLALSSCVDDLFGPRHPEVDYGACDEDGIEFTIEDDGIRSRSVNFNPSAMVKINSVWVGIFDLDEIDSEDKSYVCVSSDMVEQSFIEINSTEKGKDYQNLIRVPLTPPDDDKKGHRFFMISVVNFNDVRDQNDVLLKNRLEDIKTWNEFINIAVDTKSGYSYPHDADSPMMAGFLRHKDDANRNAVHIQVDQFHENLLFPSSLIEEQKDKVEDYDIIFNYDDTTKEKYDTSGKSVRLRRLVANINVNIKVDNPDIQLTNVTYRRHNMPEAVYIIERRTVDFKQENNSFTDITVPETADEAANYADKMWDESKGKRGYTDDEEWQIDTNRDANTGDWSFSFQHFANKHWAKNTCWVDGKQDYSKREAREKDKSIEYDEGETVPYYYTALADDINDFNNNASYFEIKMHLLDTKRNRCAEAVYIIHEGYTSNPDGTEAPRDSKGNPTGNVDDFTVARNINYIYNVIVKGFDNIFVNLNGDENGNKNVHYPDQGGKVWEMIYINDPTGKKSHYFMDPDTGENHFEDILTGTGAEYSTEIKIKDENDKEITGKYRYFPKAVTFGIFPNIAFRLYGYTNYRTKYNKNSYIEGSGISGYNYNFERSSFTNLFGLWPQSAGDYSHYFMDDISLDIEEIPADLRNGVVIIDPDDPSRYPMNLVEFVKTASLANKEKSYDVYIRESELNLSSEFDKEQYVRAIYMADRNGIYDKDNCSQIVKIYCAAQYPDYKDQVFQVVDVAGQVIPSEGRTVDINNGLSGNFSGGDIHGGKGMVTSAHPDYAFRIMGYDDDGHYVDVCLNFDVNKLIYKKIGWPVLSKNLTTLLPSNIEHLLANIGIRMSSSNSQIYTLKDVLTGKVNMSSLSQYYPNGFVFGKYEDINEGTRSIYIFDKNLVEQPALLNKTDDKFYYQIYGATQEAQDTRVMAKNITPLYHNRDVKDPNPILGNSGKFKEIVYRNGLWDGCVYSKIDIEWEPIPGINEYRLTISNAKNDIKVIRVPSTSVKDGNMFYTLITNDGIRPGTYNLAIDPDPSIYKPNPANKFEGKLLIADTYWNFQDMDVTRNLITDYFRKREASSFNAGGVDARGYSNVIFEINGLHFNNKNGYYLRGTLKDAYDSQNGGNGFAAAFATTTIVPNPDKNNQSFILYLSANGILKINYTSVAKDGNDRSTRYFLFEPEDGTVAYNQEENKGSGTMQSISVSVKLNSQKDYMKLYVHSVKAFRYFSFEFTPGEENEGDE